MTRLTLSEIAERLNLNMETFNRWIKQGRIPVRKSGNFGIFNESELNKWAAKQRISYKTTKKKEKKKENIFSSILFSAVKKGGLFENLMGDTKEEIIRSAVNLMPDFSNEFKEKLYIQIMEREKLTSTGIGKGVAIPHPRTPLNGEIAQSMIVTYFLENAMDFDSIDGKPVFVLFFILAPSIEIHLNLLSRLSFCLRDNSFIDFLEQRPDFDTFLSRIQAMERNINEKGF